MQIGDRVMFGDPNGSIGTITNTALGGSFYVTWNYGQDVRGAPITSLSRCGADQLLLLEEDWYQRYIDCRAWTDAQLAVRKEICGKIEARVR